MRGCKAINVCGMEPMTNEERELIGNFMGRVGGAPQSGAPQSGGFLATSVPSTQPALPPIDREADQFIAQQMQMYPEARYRITQTALVQEAALAEASNRIQRLQWELQQTQQAMQQQQQQQPAGQSRGFLGGLFGGGQAQQPPPRPGQGGPQASPWGQQAGAPAYGGYQPTSAPPQPQYPPNYQPGMFQRSGSGFLGSALTTAAGVAGGMVVGNVLMNAFSGSHGSAATSSWGSNTGSPGSLFDGSGVDPTDPTAGFANNAGNAGYSDPFAGGGDAKTDGGFDTQTNSNWDSGSGGGFDSGSSGGGFDDNT